MKKLTKKPCQTCNKLFLPKRPNNVFCQRRCFKLADYKRQKLLKGNGFPSFKCPACDNIINLNFNPVKKPQLWANFKCPSCNVLLICVVDCLSTEDIQLF